MKRIKIPLILILGLLFSTVVQGAGFLDLTNIPLEWKPTTTISTLKAIDLTVYKKARFVIGSFGDARKNPKEIGRNIERKFAGRKMLVTTKDSVPDWLAFRVARIFSDFDLTVVKSNGNLKLEADVVKFYVLEESTYRAEVTLKVRLKSADNKKIWEGLTTGTVTRVGGSFRADNYYETLSDATILAVHNLLRTNSFLQAVDKAL